ncbi:MAG: hypothetical protein KAT28_05240 [Candidatus Aenigmarchaeota archaeon]|nr:hypothetical protein [Candidatus Aenigmarchaeota archaeon]
MFKDLLEKLGLGPEYYEWEKDGDKYTLEIFKERNRKRIEQHKLTIKYTPEDKTMIKPVTEEDWKEMCHPKYKGPLKESPCDGRLKIEIDDAIDGYEARFQIYFLDGKFLYGIDARYQEFHEPEDVKKRLQEYFCLKNENGLAKYLNNSNLPEEYKKEFGELF